MKGFKTMKRDVQVSVILGVIILAIIGVFLSTRTTVKEPIIPVPEAEEDIRVGMLDIKELSQLPSDSNQDDSKELTTTVQEREQAAEPAVNTEIIQKQLIEKGDNLIEGEWKKAKEETMNVLSEVSTFQGQEIWKDISSDDGNKSSSKFQFYKVQPNDDLHKIAKKHYGDVNKWQLIFNANQDKIHDRNSLKIGTELIIPKENPASLKTNKETTTPALSQVTEVETTIQTAKKHTVQQSDSLYKLAVKYYNDGAQWKKILEANKQILKNQNSLKVGQDLVIPDL